MRSRRRRGPPLPQTDAEITAWNVGRELADHPERQLFTSEEHPTGNLVEWTPERIDAMQALGTEEFLTWLAAGGVARDLELQQTT